MADRKQSEQHAAQRQKELLAEALEKARTEGGVLLNQAGKTAPRLHPRDTGVSAFNALVLALHSDRGGYRTNLYTPFPRAKRDGDAVKDGEKGVPFIWYRWNEYRSKADEGKTVTKAEYDALPAERKEDYSPVRDRQVRTLFNIEQTTLPLSDPEAFRKALKEHGTPADRQVKNDKQTRIDVNLLLDRLAENLVPIRKDGTGVAHWDSAKDVIHLPAQKHYPDYASYVQDAFRQVVSATGHPGRTDRPGTAVEGLRDPGESHRVRERLVVELASAVKMNELGLPARLSPESLPLVESWKKSLENPRFVEGIEADVNRAAGMIAKAERGEKVGLRPIETRSEQQSETVSAKLSMVQDDAGKWALHIKPEGEKGFAVYPLKADVGRYFAAVKAGGEMDMATLRDLAQKYIALAKVHPEMKADLFATREKDLDLSDIKRVTIVRTREKDANGEAVSRILCAAEIEGLKEQPEPREVSPAQWQRMWLTEDKDAYKRNLAATLFADVLRRQQEMKQVEAVKQEEQKRENTPEQKAKE
ncbi:MAG: ssDNA-binding domain-containing protein [Oscillospiraceae bacterium]|nr:ssDNA-binding domain-containing protein [Oscillospiraceae bacterium]